MVHSPPLRHRGATVLWAAGLLTLAVGCEASDARPPPVFAALRHPPVADPMGPYRIEVAEVAGPRAEGGRLEYTVTAQGPQEKGVVPLQPDGPARWMAELPGRPPGSEFRYHFSFDFDGGTVRHPRSPEAWYRFRVVSARPVRLEVPMRPREGREGVGVPAVPVSLTVEALAPPSALVRYRAGRGEFRESVTARVERVGSGRYRLSASIPGGPAGTLRDFFFELTTGGDDSAARVLVPPDAPTRFYSLKTARGQVVALTGGSHVRAVATSGGRLWVGLAGGGLLKADGESVVRRWTVADGLPSPDITSLGTDPATGRLYVGTAGGAVALVPGSSPEPVLGPAFFAELPWSRDLHPLPRVRVLAVSPLDGSVYLALDPEEPELERPVPVQLALLNEIGLAPWALPLREGEPTAIDSAFFDPVTGCLLLGAAQARTVLEPRPVVVRLCGHELSELPVSLGSSPEGEPSTPLAVEALARLPATGALAVAVRYRVSREGRPVERSGVFRLGDGLVPLADGLTGLVEPVTAMLVDWRQQTLWVATAGGASFALRPGPDGGGVRATALALGAQEDLACQEVTSLGQGPQGEVLAGTPCGLIELRGEAARPVLPEAFATGAVQPELLPADLADGSLLLRSPGHGLVEVEIGGAGAPRVIRNLAAGRELPAGEYVGATLVPGSRRLLTIVRDRGILQVGVAGDLDMLGPESGLHRPRADALLAEAGSGQRFLAFLPEVGSPGPVVLQRLADDPGGELTFGTPVPYGESVTGPLADLLLVPERQSLFAAGPGVVELGRDGSVERLSGSPAAALARHHATGSVLAVGPVTQLWEGSRWSPVSSRVHHPRYSPGRFVLRHALDVAPGPGGGWYVLHAGGDLTLRSPEGHIVQVMDSEDGVPVTAQRLLSDPGTGLLVVGSSAEGSVLFFGPARARAKSSGIPPPAPGGSGARHSFIRLDSAQRSARATGGAQRWISECRVPR